jgi:hypothetical protein
LGNKQSKQLTICSENVPEKDNEIDFQPFNTKFVGGLAPAPGATGEVHKTAQSNLLSPIDYITLFISALCRDHDHMLYSTVYRVKCQALDSRRF